MPFRRLLLIYVLCGLCLSLAACQTPRPVLALIQSVERTPFPATGTPFQAQSPTAAPTITLTPTPVPSATPAPSPTLPPCTDQAGKIEAREVQIPASDGPFNFRVYTPPCFGQNPAIRYPVLYMIHGQTFSDDQWERIGIGTAADALINTGKAPPFLIVMPEEEDTIADIYVESFGRDVINGLLPWIDAHYPTCAERACRAIGGLSRGGAWALHLGFSNWQLFGAIGLHSTPPFNTDPGLFPTWVRAIPTDEMPRVYMDIGSRDPFLSMASAFESQLEQYNVPHEWYLFNGTHAEAYWSAHVSEYLEWYTRPWNDLVKSLLKPAD